MEAVEERVIRFGIIDGAFGHRDNLIIKRLLLCGEHITGALAVFVKVGYPAFLKALKISREVELRIINAVLRKVVTVGNALDLAESDVDCRCDSRVVVFKLMLLTVEEPCSVGIICC